MTLDAFKDGAFIVTKSDKTYLLYFSSLIFGCLNRKKEYLKGHGSSVVTTQDEFILDWLVHITPYLVRIFNLLQKKISICTNLIHYNVSILRPGKDSKEKHYYRRDNKATKIQGMIILWDLELFANI